MKYLLSSLTDKGRRKNVNQDSVLLRSSNYSGEENILAVVCDGMGGFEKGELASAEVIRLFSIWFDEIFPGFVNADQIEEFEDKIKGILEGKLKDVTEKGYKVVSDREIKTVGKKLIQVYKDLMNNKI